jgi:hypothetical protein
MTDDDEPNGLKEGIEDISDDEREALESMPTFEQLIHGDVATERSLSAPGERDYDADED